MGEVRASERGLGDKELLCDIKVVSSINRIDVLIMKELLERIGKSSMAKVAKCDQEAESGMRFY